VVKISKPLSQKSHKNTEILLSPDRFSATHGAFQVVCDCIVHFTSQANENRVGITSFSQWHRKRRALLHRALRGYQVQFRFQIWPFYHSLATSFLAVRSNCTLAPPSQATLLSVGKPVEWSGITGWQTADCCVCLWLNKKLLC